MKILITGANGFLGKNLFATLEMIRQGRDPVNRDLHIDEIFCWTRMTPPNQQDRFCAETDIVFHFAGVNRADDPMMFEMGNVGFTQKLLEGLQRHNPGCPVVYASSIQAGLKDCRNAPYGLSKRCAERLVKEYGTQTGASVYIYRFPNVFGKWCRPDYNSVVATFCQYITHGRSIAVREPKRVLSLAYVDDLVQEMLQVLRGKAHLDGAFYHVRPAYTKRVEEIAEILLQFAQQREKQTIPCLPEGSFEKKLYSTFLSYLPEAAICADVVTHMDERGSFAELFRLFGDGQVSVNVTKPGATKGEHWHHSKWEVFAVVSGSGVIRMRDLFSDCVVEYRVSGERLQLVWILPGYVHSLVNTDESNDLVTFMWSNEHFDPKKPDTYFEKVSV